VVLRIFSSDPEAGSPHSEAGSPLPFLRLAFFRKEIDSPESHDTRDRCLPAGRQGRFSEAAKGVGVFGVLFENLLLTWKRYVHALDGLDCLPDAQGLSTNRPRIFTRSPENFNF
jgi:hypothetical protein